MTQRESAATIDEAASDWASRIDRGLNLAEERELQGWIDGDSRRLGALSRAEAAWIHAERAASLGECLTPASIPLIEQSEDLPKRSYERRRFLIGGGALAASVAAAFSLRTIFSDGQRWRTAVGEIRKVELGGGSWVRLDTASELALSTVDGAQQATLISGRAFFSIVPIAGRLFTVGARELAIAAGKSAFSVSMIDEAALQIVVITGRVAITVAGGSYDVPLTVLQRGMEMMVPSSVVKPATIRRVPDSLLEGAVRWQSGLLRFDGTALSDAAAMFNRYGGTQISVADGTLAGEPVTGVFRSSDAAGFAKAAATTLDAKTIKTGNGVAIVR